MTRETLHAGSTVTTVMKRVWALFKAHPYISNVAGYTALFASADLIQQSMLGGRRTRSSEVEDSAQLGNIDWSQTARVALVGFCFHANFNYHWLKGLEKMMPGGGIKKISGKVVLDQLVAAPATISAFFIGLSLLENKEDPLEDWRETFWTSYTTGVVFWSSMQAVNFTLVPPVARTVFAGGISLVWTIYLCHLRQQQTQSSGTTVTLNTSLMLTKPTPTTPTTPEGVQLMLTKSTPTTPTTPEGVQQTMCNPDSAQTRN